MNNPNFIYFSAQPKSIEDEEKWLENTILHRNNNFDWNYTILYNDKIVGDVGIKINQHRKYIGEIGFFLDENFWGRGITTEAVRLVEKEGFEKMLLMRIEIIMQPENKASEMVAIKCGYKKEGLLKKLMRGKDGDMKDCWLYSKVV